jgi:hypothetical protein
MLQTSEIRRVGIWNKETSWLPLMIALVNAWEFWSLTQAQETNPNGAEGQSPRESPSDMTGYEIANWAHVASEEY